MKVNLNFMVLMIFLTVLALMYPIVCGILITFLLINQLRKKDEVPFDAELSQQQCIEVFYKFITAMCEKKNDLQEKICLTKYKLERIPVRIFEAEVENSSKEQMKIKFTLLSTLGDILINKAIFIPKNGHWVIKEIQ